MIRGVALSDASSEKEQLRLLYMLQQIDTEIGTLLRRRAQLDDSTSLRHEVENLTQAFECEHQELKKLEATYHDRELQLKGIEEKRKRDRDRLFSGTIGNPKELKDLDEEVKMLTKQKGEIEEELLMMMEELDAKRRIVDEKRMALEKKQAELQQREEQYAQEGQEIDTRVATLAREREPYLSSIEEPYLEMYDRLRQRAANLAVVTIEGEVCSGCSIQLTSFLLKKLQESDAIVSCENCGRMLYWEPEVETVSG